jgi:hypothetical protein
MSEPDIEAQAAEKRKAWRRERRAGKLLTTASGLVLRVKRATLIDLVRAGHVPQPLLGAVDELFNAGKLTLSDAVRYMDAVDAIVRVVVVEPRIVDGESDKDDELGLAEMTADEKLSVINYINSTPVGLFAFLGDATR